MQDVSLCAIVSAVIHFKEKVTIVTSQSGLLHGQVRQTLADWEQEVSKIEPFFAFLIYC